MSASGSRHFLTAEKFLEFGQKSLWPGIDTESSIPYPGEVHISIDKTHIPGFAAKINGELGFPLIQIAASDEREVTGSFKLYYTFASARDKFIVVTSTMVDEKDCTFPSITPVVHAAHWYEREIKDYFGLIPEGHPDTRRLCLHPDWPKRTFPMRRDFKIEQDVPRRTDGKSQFRQVEGEGVIQIPVGPIHAGIIEPGHFRFSAVGENVINLEARLFYTHRGMEKLAEGSSPDQGLLLAERICGACSFSHSTAYSMAVEKLAGTAVPERAEFIRTVALELERLYNHIGDTGNICAGVGLAFGTMHGARLKETVMHLNETVFGSRFLRGINTPGGVRRDIKEKHQKLIAATLVEVERDFKELTDIMLTTESFMDRVEGTGKLQLKTALELHAVGPAARAAGIDRDIRRDHPYAAYDKILFGIPVYESGDVLARLKMRIDETFESIDIILQALELMPRTELRAELGEMQPYAHAVGITESPRGENIHLLISGPENTIFRHMVRSASYCNWPVLPTTVPGNIVPDFPLINKSFELCYSCLDR
jgi:Ni,Fe-hydrogenase III large subunit/Ni,Fe-hydrogenase III component G